MSAPQILGTETYLDKTHAHPADQRLQRKPERHPFTHAGVSNHLASLGHTGRRYVKYTNTKKN